MCLVLEHEALVQADTSAVSERARRLARHRSFAGLAIFGVAALTAPQASLLGFAPICCALVLYLRPDATS